MDKEQALQLVQKYLDKIVLSDNEDKLVVIEDSIIEKPYGWVFIYNSKKFIDTGNIFLSLSGNGPVIVEKDTGQIHQLGSSLSIENAIKDYEDSQNL